MSLGEEPSYPMEDEENTTPTEREVEEDVILKGEGDKSAQLPGTWAARISQVNEGCGMMGHECSGFSLIAHSFSGLYNVHCVFLLFSCYRTFLNLLRYNSRSTLRQTNLYRPLESQT